MPLLLQQCGAATPACDLLVVDNDPAAGAGAVASTFPSVKYVHEPRAGISAARNRALLEAAGRPALIFIDDDEVPVVGWLQSLLDLHRSSGAAAVVGPVVSQFDEAPGEWIALGRVFERRRLATGTLLDVAASNNLLLDLAQVTRYGLTFDERFGLTGGSDTLFTRQLAAAGGRMVWCDEALVYDGVPPERTTRSWVLRRALRSGNTWARTSLLLAPSWRARTLVRVGLLAAGLTRVLVGGLQTLWAIGQTSVAHRARGERAVMRGIGMLMGATGAVSSEYSRPSQPGQ